MGNVLDAILIEEPVDSAVTVNVTTEFKTVDMTFKEDAFAIQLVYENGSSVDMTLFLEVSIDGVNYSRIPDSLQVITDSSGSHIWDLEDSGVNFMRVGVEVNAGSIDVTSVRYSMRRRH